MSNIFVVAMKKGGVGKTTITLNIAEALALCGFKVLCIDNDEQHNLSNSLGLKKFNYDISDLYSGRIKPEEFAKVGVYETRVKNLYCVPCSAKINNMGKINNRNILRIFSTMVDFDHIFIDCAPGSGLIQNEIAMENAEFFILPTILKQFSFTGLTEIVNYIKTKLGMDIDDIVIIPNCVDVSQNGNIKTNKHKEFLKALNVMFPQNVTETFIPNDEVIDDVIFLKKSLFIDRLKTSKSAKYFLNLIFEIFDIDEGEIYEKINEERKKQKANKLRKAFFKRNILPEKAG